MPAGPGPADAKTRAAELLEQFGLTEAADRLAKTYSGGMRRRLDLAASLVGRPEVIFLDEPTTGLDPGKREDVWEIVRTLVDDGATVLLTTQYLEEADALADEISVIDKGRVIAHGTANGLKRRIGEQTLEVRPVDPARLAEVEAMLADILRGAPRSPGSRAAQRPRGRRRRHDHPRRPARLARHRRDRARPAAAQPGRGLLLTHRRTASDHRPPDEKEVAA